MIVKLRRVTGGTLAAALTVALAGSAMVGMASAQAPIASPIPAPVPAPQSAPQPPSQSAEPGAAETVAPPPKLVTNPVAKAALRTIEDQGLQGPMAREKDLLAALATLYTDRDRPLWTNAAGLLPVARSVIDEIGRAGEWGLNTSAFDLPALATGETTIDAIGAAEVALSYAVLKYGWHAQGGRLEPTALSLWLDQKARPLDVAAVLSRIADSGDPVGVLRKLHPQHPQFELLRQAYLKARGVPAAIPASTAAKTFEPLPPGPMLRPGMRHPDIALLRRRLDVEAGDEPTLYDRELADAVRAFLRQAGLNGSPLVGAQARAALNAPAGSRAPKVNANEAVAKRILANMERWRWLPSDLGSIHVWNNLPEFETRVVKDGQVVHQERIIIGKPETQTPVFSDTMRVVVFQPDWGVPNSIKIKDLLPKLQDGDEDALSRKGMRIAMNGKTVDASKFNWDKVDIRTIPIVQDPGPSNPLGQIKFLFPNKHDVYMHDTPSKHLFNEGSRMFSHGCIRVRNPRKLAEVVFGEDQGWEPKEISDRLKSTSPANTRVALNRRIPVHNAYFTVIAGDSGALRTLTDIYGHDRRITAALDGVPAAQIAQSDPARKLAQELRDITGDPGEGPAAGRSSSAKAKPLTTGSIARVAVAAPIGRSALGGPVPVRTAPRPATYTAAPSPKGYANSGPRAFSFQSRTLDGQ
jgi:L,D-transpeptidase YcbB